MAKKRVSVKKRNVAQPAPKENVMPPGQQRLAMVSYGDLPEHMGAYRSRKIYNVIGPDGKIDKTVDGYVVQLVEKSSKAIVNYPKPRELKTSADFENFTDGTVQYMCETYIERFPIKKGKLYNMSDEFTNGPIARVEEGEAIVISEPYGDPSDKPYESSGQISHKGTNLLFTSPERKEKLEALDWKIRKAGPENGLYYLPYSKAQWAALLAIGNDSTNMPIHKVTAKWGFEPSDTDLVVEFLDNPKVAGKGGKRRTYRR